MFIHFAFSDVGKQGKIKEQTEKVIEKILRTRRLKYSQCVEFLPSFNEQNSLLIPPERFKITSKNEISADIRVSKLQPALPVSFSPLYVEMICFTQLPFNKLNRSTLYREYGRFGIVFTDDFLKVKGLKRVRYYTETSVLKDPIVRRWNQVMKLSLGEKAHLVEEKKSLEKEIVFYRKPATSFRCFKESYIKVIASQSEITMQFVCTYDRYDDGYDFTKENEYRIVCENVMPHLPTGEVEAENYLSYRETDIRKLIVPNEESKAAISDYVDSEWNSKPEIMVYPTC